MARHQLPKYIAMNAIGHGMERSATFTNPELEEHGQRHNYTRPPRNTRNPSNAYLTPMENYVDPNRTMNKVPWTHDISSDANITNACDIATTTPRQDIATCAQTSKGHLTGKAKPAENATSRNPMRPLDWHLSHEKKGHQALEQRPPSRHPSHT